MRSRVLLALLALLIPAPRASATVPVERFLDRLTLAEDEARAGEQAPSRGRMERLREIVGLPDEVLIDGRTIRLPKDPLLEALEGQEAGDFTTAAGRLGALSGEAEAAVRTARPDVEAIRAAVAGGAERPPLVLRIWRRILSFLAGLLSAIGSTTVGTVLLLVGLAGLGLGIAALVARSGVRIGARVVPVGGPSVASVQTLRAEVGRALRSGDREAAVRLGYQALIATAVRRGLVDDRPSLTAAVLRRAGAATEYDLALRDATRRYERVRYGRAPAREEDVVALLGAEREMDSR